MAEPQTGERGLWQMSGTSYTGTWTPLGVVSPVWSIVGSADFSCDAKPDIVWENTVTGERGFWVMNGTTYTGQWLPLGSVSTEWHIAAVGDFTGDGKPDVLWENTQTGERGIWPMNCATYTGTWIGIGSVAPVWRIVAAADLTGDANPDVVWNNGATGETVIWAMNNAVYSGTQYALGYGSQWQIATAGDFTCDDKTDLVWQNTASGDRMIWGMNGPAKSSEFSLGTVGTTWDIAAVLSNAPSCGVQVTIEPPTATQFVGDTLTVSASATSNFQVSGVTAAVSNRQVTLTFSTPHQRWMGKLPIVGLPRGAMQLTVSATDASGATGTATRNLVHDAPPIVSVATPEEAVTARPSIHVTATCADDGTNGCVHLEVYVGAATPTPLASGVNSVNTDVSLAAFEGTSVHLVFLATDDAGQVGMVTRDVFVESNTRLVTRYVLPYDARFYDVLGDSVLYGMPVGNGTEIRLHRIAGNTETVLGSYAGTSVERGVLYSGGAVFTTRPCGVTYCFAQASGGTSVVFGSSNNFSAAGDYFFWEQSGSGNYLRNFATNSSTQISSPLALRSDVASNGQVVYEGFDGLTRYRDGAITVIDPGPRITGPVTDGTDILVVSVVSGVGSNPNTYEVRRYPLAGGYQVLSTVSPSIALDPPRLAPHRDFDLKNGYAVYPSTDQLNVTQTWIRPPNGTPAQVTFFSTRAYLEGIGNAGEAMFYRNNTRYLSKPPYVASPPSIGSAQGTAFWRGPRAYVLLGRTLFEVTL